MKRRSFHELEERGQGNRRKLTSFSRPVLKWVKKPSLQKHDVPIPTVGGRAEEKESKVKTLRSRKRIMVCFVHSCAVLLFLMYINKILV